jgi:acetyltransferase
MAKNVLDLFFKPASVAVIGASDKANSIGRVLVENLKTSGFTGSVYPINPNYAEIIGYPVYPSISEVGEPIDLAIIAIPIQDVPGVLAQCGQAGVPAAIITSAGGREIGATGQNIEEEIAQAARKANLRYLGPNSMGIFCPLTDLNASLMSYPARRGNIAVISQSGAICNTILGWANRKNLGFSHFINIGSMADLDFDDFIDYLGNEINTRSIVIYMESLNHHRQFMSAARSVSRVKPIIVIKAGRSPAGARASASHTGALAGLDAAYSAAFRRAGVIRVNTFTQLFDCAEALEKMPRPTGGALGIITNAGGPGVMAVDAVSSWNLEPATLGAETLAQLNDFLPPYWSHSNPIDILGNASVKDYLKTIEICLTAPEINGLIIILAAQALTDPIGIARDISLLVKGQGKPVLAVWMGGEDVEEGLKFLNEAGIPTFETPEQAVDTYMEMYFYNRHLELIQETPPQQSSDVRINARQGRSFITQCLDRGARILTEMESKAILSAYGIPVTPTVAAASPREAAHAAQELGYPVVLKILSPDISHKSDQSGVRFYLRSEVEVKAAYEQMAAETRERYPDARLLGVTVQAQERHPDLELHLGCKQDPQFGPLILFGWGGIYTEALQDFALDLPPLNLLLAQRLIQKTKIFKLLQGYRQIPLVSIDVLADILVRLSQLAADCPEIVELDINPLILTSGRAMAVEVRLSIAPSPVPAPRHLIISPYPNQYESDLLLRDGTPVLLRPIKPEDEPLVYRLLQSCSEQTIYFRYFHRIRKFTHELLIRFTQNDYDREIALIAVGQPPGPPLMLGVCRLVMTPDRKKGEFAILIGDPWQGKGLGFTLMERIIGVAKDYGVRHLYGDVLLENEPMLEMMKRLGFSFRKNIEEGTFRVEMRL